MGHNKICPRLAGNGSRSDQHADHRRHGRDREGFDPASVMAQFEAVKHSMDELMPMLERYGARFSILIKDIFSIVESFAQILRSYQTDEFSNGPEVAPITLHSARSGGFFQAFLPGFRIDKDKRKLFP